jgi:hypothetical protein
MAAVAGGVAASLACKARAKFRLGAPLLFM